MSNPNAWSIKWPVDFESLMHPSVESVKDVNENRSPTLWQCVCTVKGWILSDFNSPAYADSRVLLTIDELLDIELLYRTGVRRKQEVK